MAGLFDFLDQDQAGGLLPYPAPPSGIGPWLGNNSNMLIALGAGLASGNTLGDGLAKGLQLALQGRKRDRAQQAAQMRPMAIAQALRRKGFSDTDIAAAVAHPDVLRGLVRRAT